jgi:hypothetical protein
MSSAIKRLSESPRKVQTEMTAFTGKRTDNKNTPPRSYAQAVSANRFEPLSEDDEDEVMEEAQASDSSDATPNQDNTKSSSSATKEKFTNPLSKKSHRKMNHAAKKDVTRPFKKNQTRILSSATRATLERARKAKELLQKSMENSQEDPEETIDKSGQDKSDKSERTEEEDSVESEEGPDVSNSESKQKEVQEKEQAQPVVTQQEETMSIPGNSDNASKDQQTMNKKINNPYSKSNSKPKQGILHARQQKQVNNHPKSPMGSNDKQIILKKGVIHPHVHRYTLRIKIIKSKSEEDEQVLVQKQKFFDIVLQGDPMSIIPPYFDLDRSDNDIPDLSTTFNVAALDSYYSLKRYFSCLSPRSEEGFVWCSIILAQASSFASFMEKTRYSLENQAFSLWPKASDHELATDAGWLLYSTRQQDEERMADLLSSITGDRC